MQEPLRNLDSEECSHSWGVLDTDIMLRLDPFFFLGRSSFPWVLFAFVQTEPVLPLISSRGDSYTLVRDRNTLIPQLK